VQEVVQCVERVGLIVEQVVSQIWFGGGYSPGQLESCYSPSGWKLTASSWIISEQNEDPDW